MVKVYKVHFVFRKWTLYMKPTEQTIDVYSTSDQKVHDKCKKRTYCGRGTPLKWYHQKSGGPSINAMHIC
jgi:hypothetical protein